MLESVLSTAAERMLASELTRAKDRAAATLEAGAWNEHEEAKRDLRRALDRFADFVLRGIVPEELAGPRRGAARESMRTAA